MNIVETILNIPVEHIRNLFGQFDAHAKQIEKTMEVTLIARDNELKILGDVTKVQKTKAVLEELLKLSMRGNTITEQNVNYALALSMEDKVSTINEIDKDLICHTIQGKPIKPKTLGQKNYVDLIRKKMIVFGIGPAGTGKTYLAMAMGIQAFKNDEVSRIILTRPAIEAGEKLGFLPGDLQSKVDPYLRPLYDALYQIMGPESFQKNMEKGLIEVAPLAYMRGRTLDNAFIILDEAQNTTPAQMKMFLTRIGFGSKVIITGDLTQKDLPAGAASGLDIALKVLSKVDDIGFATLTGEDVVRHPLVQKIVKAYDDYESKKAKYEQSKPTKTQENTKNTAVKAETKPEIKTEKKELKQENRGFGKKQNQSNNRYYSIIRKK
ncbi:MAG: PhoH family protein [Lachnospiraceae bacterium]|nr:PhoH family protein [Lachnospiraceae bacterium]